MKRLFYFISILSILVSCQQMQVSDDPSLRLSFSQDTVRFDTVFTTIGSSTMQLMVRNNNDHALRIEKIGLQNGKYFKVNVDGETDLDRLSGIEIAGGDSLYVFVRVYIDPLRSNAPIRIEDALQFALNGHTQAVRLEAYGQDMHLIRTTTKRSDFEDFTFLADKPYLIYDSIVVANQLTLQAGAQLYMHNGAGIWALGNVEAKGTKNKPIRILGDRRDLLFDNVPYIHAAGLWDGLYLLNYADAKPANYHLDHVEILSGHNGLYLYSEQTNNLPTLTLTNSRIHNQAGIGLYLEHVNAEIANTEISNCASYCAYLKGGKHTFTHTTIAAYFGATNINIQSTQRENVPAVYIDDLSKEKPQTRTSFINSVVTGIREQQLVLATPLPRYYAGNFIGNYLKTDTLRLPHAKQNCYWQETDTLPVFRNTFYEYKVYDYYDFRPDSLSPLLGIADSIAALAYPIDKNGIPRTDPTTSIKPDAGCYQHTNY